MLSCWLLCIVLSVRVNYMHPLPALLIGKWLICAGVDGLSKKIQEVKDFVDEKVDALSRKQDDLAESQDEMKDQLEDVQQNISGVTHTYTCFMLQTNQSIHL